MAEGARLESVYTATYRGFESPPHRHIRDESLYESTGSFLLYSPQGGMRTPDRGSTTGNASWTDREPASGLPRRGELSESIPPHRHILRRARTQVRAFFSHVAPTGGDREPPTGVRQLTTDITQYCQSQTLLHTINSAAKMFANTIPSSALSHPA